MESTSSYLTATHDGYDRTAASYADRLPHHLDDKPVGLAILCAFAALVMQGPKHRVLDVGCATRTTTSGVDLSSNMIDHARRLNPSLHLEAGSMPDLTMTASTIGGLCRWYSVIHVPDDHVSDVFEESRRVAKGIFSVLSTNKQASDIFNGQAGHDAIDAQMDYANDFKNGVDMSSDNHRPRDSMTLQGLVDSGIQLRARLESTAPMRS